MNEQPKTLEEAAAHFRVSRRMIEPRVLSKEDAALYAGCKSVSAFSRWVRDGIMPGPIPGTNRWDRKAIDDALDRHRAQQPKIVPQASAYDQWKAAQNAGEAQGHPHDLQKAR
jgi:hypothetical protein